jgi:branched-chain amino acid transport system substrate-binding protein
MGDFHAGRRNFCLSTAALLLSTSLPALAASDKQSLFPIGALNPTTGAGAVYGAGMQKVIVATADSINALGGASGRKFKVFTADGEAKPDAAVLAARKLLDVDHAQAILGTWASGVTLAVMPLTNGAGAILMNTSGAPSVSEQNTKGLSWRFEANNKFYGRAFYDAVRAAGFKKPATLSINNASGLSITDGFAEEWKSHGGKIAKRVVYEPNQASYRSEVQQIIDAEPDIVVLGAYVPDATIVLREWYQTGYETRWMMPSFAGNADLVKALGPQVCEGVLSVGTIANEGSQALKAFDELYRKLTGKAGSTNPYAAYCYDMVVVLALAMEAAGPGASTERINEMIRQVAGNSGTVVTSFEQGRAELKRGRIRYDGASSKLAFNAKGDATPNFAVEVVHDGVLKRQSVITF